MAGAMGAAARGAFEAGERGGGQPQADLAGSQGVEGGRGVVWDHAAFFTRRRRWERGAPYAPESCGAGICRVRRWVEGRRYERIDAKKAALEEVLQRLEAEGKVSSLVGWRYIRQALHALLS